MKKLLASLVVSVSILVSGCTDGLSNREVSCLEYTGNIHCKSEGQYAVDQQRAERGVVMGQSYTNHYGNPQHGAWSNGQYNFHNPNGIYATQTDSFLLGAGIGGLAAYALTSNSSRGSWEKENPSGFKVRKKSYNRPRDKSGKIISKVEAKKRKDQSNRDKLKNRTISKNKTRQADKKDLNLTKNKVTNHSSFKSKNNSFSKQKPQQRKATIRKVRKTTKSYKKR